MKSLRDKLKRVELDTPSMRDHYYSHLSPWDIIGKLDTYRYIIFWDLHKFRTPYLEQLYIMPRNKIIGGAPIWRGNEL
jgi:hypothetical protein